MNKTMRDMIADVRTHLDDANELLNVLGDHESPDRAVLEFEIDVVRKLIPRLADAIHAAQNSLKLKTKDERTQAAHQEEQNK